MVFLAEAAQIVFTYWTVAGLFFGFAGGAMRLNVRRWRQARPTSRIGVPPYWSPHAQSNGLTKKTRTLMNTVAKLTALLTLLVAGAHCFAQEDTTIKDASLPSAENPTAEQQSFFTDRVLPILSKHCWECHGEEVQESGLRLDSREGLLSGGDSGETIAVEGKPAESYLIKVLQHDGDVDMPPDQKLPPAEIDVLHHWVETGLAWPSDTVSNKPLTKQDKFAQQLEQHWSFQPIVAPELPEVQGRQWVTQPLDQFILAHLEHQGLAPAPQADRYTLIRRVKFDLLGLPPTADEVTAFINDTAPDAYEQLVDRYLASPHYGERWGRHWLDVARYADTKGYAFTRDRRYPFSYTYRDYVIEAFNDDLPFDQFILEQLAADLLSKEPNDPHLAALGFLTVGRKYNNRHLDIDDQIDVVGRGLLGLTVACARCHDHKYDPIPTDDYYSLYGVFASSSEPDELPIIGDPTTTPGYAEYKQELDKRQAALDTFKQKKRDEIADSARQHATDYLARAITQEPEESLQEKPFIALKGEEFKPRLVQRWRKFLATTAKADHPVLGPMYELALLPNQEYATKAVPIVEKWKNVPAGTQPGALNPIVKEAFAKEPPLTKLDLARTYGQVFSSVYAQQQEAAKQPPNNTPSEATGSGSPSPTTTLDPAAQQVLDILIGPGALTDISVGEVAGLLTRAEGNEHRELQRKLEAFQVDSPGSPPRAMVVREGNTPHTPRIFIRGNHGRPGKEVPRQFLLAVAGPDRKPFEHGSGRLELAQAIVSPTNPLTARVIANRIWMHHFGKPLVSTPSDFGTRCQRPIQADTLDHLASQLMASKWSLKTLHREIALSNTYRQSSLRRDECAAIDPENMLYGRMNRRRLEFEAMRDAMLAVSGELDLTMGGRPAKLSEPPYSLRRAVYGYIDRQDLPGLFRVFDLASPDQSCPERPRTTVPQQALFIMNSPFVIERAKQMATLPAVVAASGVAQRIDALYQAVLARSPSEAETEIGRQFIEAVDTEGSGEKENNGKDNEGEKINTEPPNAWQQYAQVLLMSNAFLFVD